MKETKYGVFDTETGNLIRGPFTKSGAERSRRAVIENAVQHELLYDVHDPSGIKYRLYTTWACNPEYKKDPDKMVGMREEIIKGFITGKNPYTKDDIDELKSRFERYENIIEVKEVNISY